MAAPLTDYHMHSSEFSPDARAPMEAMCRGAIGHGLEEIAITDHLDGHPMDYCHGYYRPDAYFAELERCRELFAGQLVIRAGVELGDGHRFGEALAAVVDPRPYDFAIGSVHWIDDVAPFGEAFYSTYDAAFAYGGYFREALALATTGDFEVLGHIDMPKREGTAFYGAFGPDDYAEALREILKTLIGRGKGIELNTSGWRKSCDDCCPGLPVMKWYAELGGEILTIGSDAHRPEHIALRRDRAVEMAREAGLKWLTTFERRKPTQHRL
jgi:histidinol-phosphatase (PHP family)